MNLQQRFSAVLGNNELKKWQGLCLLRGMDGVLMTAPLLIIALLLFYPVDGEEVYWTTGLLIISYSLLFFGRKLIIWHTNRRLNQIAFEFGLEQRHSSLQHLLAIPLSAFSKLHRGAISQALSIDLLWLESCYALTLPVLLVESIAILLLLVAAFMIHWPLAAITLVLLSLAALILKGVLNRLHHVHKTNSDNLAQATRLVAEYVKGMDLLRTFGQARSNEGQFKQTVEQMRQHARQSVRKVLSGATLFFTLVQLALGVSIIALLLIYQQNYAVVYNWSVLFDLSVEENIVRALVAMLILTALNTPVRSLFTYLNLWDLAKISEASLNKIDSVAKQVNGKQCQLSSPLTVEFSNVSFHYDDVDIKALEKVSFKLHPRSITAVVGPSGAGKSTLMKLLMRFADVTEGNIFLAGQEIRDLDIATLHQQFAIVFQETVLLNDTIANNLRLGKPSASMSEIIAAAKKAQIHHKIVDLPNGYDAVFDVAGRSLSGGEKQRLAIARAILKDAPIVILDEATSALDPENEDLIQQAIAALAESKTVLMIAHHLGTITDADQIIVMDQARVVNIGKHEQLIEDSEIYSSMWQAYNEIRDWNITR